MNIKDGDDLPIHVTFEEETGEAYWHYRLAALPHVGDTVMICAAVKGARHIVKRIDHHVSGGSHRIIIVVAQAAEIFALNDELPAAGTDGEIRAGHFVATATVNSTRRNLFVMEPGKERHIGTLIAGSRSKIAEFELDCARIVAALAAQKFGRENP